MILHFNYEELSALKAGAEVCLLRNRAEGGAVLAPTEDLARVEALFPALTGDISLSTLQELREVRLAVEAIVDCLRVEMEASVLATHAADEGAVAAYFGFAHGLTVLHRLRDMESEMEAMIELVTGERPTPESARSFHFPD